MNYFTELGHHKAVIQLNVGTSTYRDQAYKLKIELSDLDSNPDFDIWDSILQFFLYDVTYSHHGFAFLYRDHILKLPLTEQRKIIAAFHKFLGNSKVIKAYDDIDYALSLDVKKRANVNWLRKYTEAHISLGFGVSLNRMLEDLSKGFSKKAIREEHQFQKIMIPEAFIA